MYQDGYEKMIIEQYAHGSDISTVKFAKLLDYQLKITHELLDYGNPENFIDTDTQKAQDYFVLVMHVYHVVANMCTYQKTLDLFILKSEGLDKKIETSLDDMCSSIKDSEALANKFSQLAKQRNRFFMSHNNFDGVIKRLMERNIYFDLEINK